jgi:hypothetical protein
MSISINAVFRKDKINRNNHAPINIRLTDVARWIDKDILKYEDILLKGLGSNQSKYTAREPADKNIK